MNKLQKEVEQIKRALLVADEIFREVLVERLVDIQKEIAKEVNNEA